ncbi:MAG: RNA polymerase sigma factor RpoD/SigA [Acidobacteriota bacterium]|nr:RNA polymerase sigma factor RpoD/SigA [Acidobacteriota bacterium]MDQ7086898.1 RNA polymerase sigma factor RpoD/SigA [Acidobacteriota bacterium]
MATYGRQNMLFSLYLQDLRGCPRVDRDGEKELARRAQQGDDEALATLVSANLPFVVSLSRFYSRRGVSSLDLINEGNLALMEAALRYDPERGTTFLTYAVWWIRKAMLRVLRDHPLVRTPEYRHRIERKVREIRREMTAALGRTPTDEELIERTELTWREVEQAEQTQGHGELSLSGRWEDEDGPSMEDRLVDEERPDAEQQVLLRERMARLDRAIGRLPSKERFILQHRYGLGGAQVMTLEEIGRCLGCSRERVRQIEMQTRARLRRLLSPAPRPAAPSCGRRNRPGGVFAKHRAIL